jgi:DNA polymerase-1
MRVHIPHLKDTKFLYNHQDIKGKKEKWCDFPSEPLLYREISEPYSPCCPPTPPRILDHNLAHSNLANHPIMFFDILLHRSLYDPRFENSDFSTLVERLESYKTSSLPLESRAEKLHFIARWYETEKAKHDTLIDHVFATESKLTSVLVRMENNGIRIDADLLTKIGKDLAHRAKKIEQEVHELIGEPFNLSSPKQVQTILFDRLKIPSGKKTKTGYSVDNETLSELSANYAIAGLILEFRSLKKLEGTYVDGLLRTLNTKTGRIHTSYSQTQTTTGRLSSENPNLQNIPSGDEASDAIKSCFIPRDENYELCVADYSQVELRILANLSKDPALIETFTRGEDIHTKTAEYIFGPGSGKNSEYRRIAKAVNFGTIYGITSYGLAKMLRINPKDAQTYIDTFFARYAGVRPYFESILSDARTKGYVETYFGRRRTIRDINDANRMIREHAEREAMNMPIQGTSADIIKRAMITIDDFLHRENKKSHLLLQVHDELVFEIHKSERDELIPFIQDSLENVVPDFPVKLTVKIGMGKNWNEAKG